MQFFNSNNIKISSLYGRSLIGTIASIGFILSINYKGKYKIYALLNMLALFYSNSRAATIALAFVMVVFFFFNKKITFKTLMKFALLVVGTYLMFVFYLILVFLESIKS